MSYSNPPILSGFFSTKLFLRRDADGHTDYPTYITKATRRDLGLVFELVNKAYALEKGSDGVAYKNCNKYRLKDQARKQLGDMILIRNHRQVRKI